VQQSEAAQRRKKPKKEAGFSGCTGHHYPLTHLSHGAIGPAGFWHQGMNIAAHPARATPRTGRRPSPSPSPVRSVLDLTAHMPLTVPATLCLLCLHSTSSAACCPTTATCMLGAEPVTEPVALTLTQPQPQPYFQPRRMRLAHRHRAQPCCGFSMLLVPSLLPLSTLHYQLQHIPRNPPCNLLPMQRVMVMYTGRHKA
jgi:hypothetical protein